MAVLGSNCRDRIYLSVTSAFISVIRYPSTNISIYKDHCIRKINNFIAVKVFFKKKEHERDGDNIVIQMLRQYKLTVNCE